MTWDDVLRIAHEFPGVEEGTCYHTPALRVRGRLLGRLHEDGDDLILRMERDTRGVLLRVRPHIFYITDHYEPYSWVRVRLATVTDSELREVFADAWHSQAPKKLRNEYEVARAGNPAAAASYGRADPDRRLRDRTREAPDLPNGIAGEPA